MANSNKINGFSPVGYLSGAAYTGAARMYAVPTADTTASYAIGDVVRSLGGSDANGVPYVIKIPAAEGQAFVPLGVIVGISVADASVSLQASALDLTQAFILKGTRTADRYVYVADDPNLLFVACAGATATNVTLAKMRYNSGIGSFYSAADQTYAIDQNASVTALSMGSPLSNIILPSSTISTGGILPVQLLGLYQTPDNTVGAYARILCRFTYHEFGISAIPGTSGGYVTQRVGL